MKCLGNSPKGVAEFLNEVKVITGIHHKNLVKLKGYCVRDAEWRLLVYNMLKTKIFMKFYGLKVQHGLNLDHTKSWNNICFSISCMPNQLKWTCFVLIEQSEDTLILDWPMQFNICMEIAWGLAYLPEEVQPCSIHWDIKLKNILLDNNFNPKIADFGLVWLFPQWGCPPIYIRTNGEN